MQDIQLIPMTPEQKDVLNIVNPHRSAPLANEASTLRGAFHLIAEALATRVNDDPDKNAGLIVTYANTLCRLSDSLVRATLASYKLARTHDEMAELQAEFRRIFIALGWGEQPPPAPKETEGA